VKYFCIDYGLARTGLAVSDPEGIMAFPRKTLELERLGSRKALLAALVEAVLAEGAQAVVLGLPLHKDGAESLTTRQVKNIAARLQRRLHEHQPALPLYFMPEFLSSEEAAADLAAAGLAPKQRKAVLDQQAAVRILESFLALPEHRRLSA
jgi:putative holliday junction resolvase